MKFAQIFSKALIVFFCILSYSACSGVIRLKAEVKHEGTAERDYITAYKMIHYSNSGASWEKSYKKSFVEELFPSPAHKGVFALALSQSRNRTAFMAELIMSSDKIPMKFMIDSGRL